MTQTNTDTNGTTTMAPLQNVALCTVAMAEAIDRPLHLPGLVVFYGPSGWGKSFSATYAANKFKAYYVEAKESWTKKSFLQAILKEMGAVPAKTISDMVDQISEQLVLSGRPLIIDEMDHLVKRNYVELVRDIYESSNAPILMIGEEHLEANLRQWERFHNRVMNWIPAQQANLEDIRHLNKLYAPKVKITDDLLEHLRIFNKGCTRRICINIERIRKASLSLNAQTMDRATWGSRELYSGKAPERRM